MGIPISRISVVDQVYDTLRAAILSGEIAQGSRIVELQIAPPLGTSRAPVREAVILGYSTFGTTERYYNQATSLEAVRRYRQTVAGRRAFPRWRS